MAWTDPPRTWTTNEFVNATIMNAHIRDQLLALSTWRTDWVPAWSATTTNPTLGNGTIVGRYIHTGEVVSFYIHVTFGSTTTNGSGFYSFDLPVAEAARPWTAEGWAIDASAGPDYWKVFAVRTGSDAIFLRADGATAGVASRGIGATTLFTWATGDQIFLGGTYEAA